MDDSPFIVLNMHDSPFICETSIKNEGRGHTDAFKWKFACGSIHSIFMTIWGTILSQPNFLTPKGSITPMSTISRRVIS